MSNLSKGLILAGICSLMWAVLAIALKVALNYIDSYTIVWWRFAFSFLFLFLLLLFKNRSSLSIIKKPSIMLVSAGILLGINFIGYQQGVNYSGPAVSQILIQLGAVTFALIGFLFFKEPINRVKIVGFLIALTGFVLFFYKQIGDYGHESNNMKTGVIWLLVSAWSWTGYAVLNKLLVRKIKPAQINLYLYGIPTLMFLPFADFKVLFAPHSFAVWMLLIFVALNTVVSYGSLSMAMKYIEANQASMIIILNPVLTFIILESMFWLNINWFDSPVMMPLAYIGAALVLTGAFLAMGAKIKRE